MAQPVTYNLDRLFSNKDVVTTRELTEILGLACGKNASRNIKIRARRMGIGLQNVGHNAWVRIH